MFCALNFYFDFIVNIFFCFLIGFLFDFLFCVFVCFFVFSFFDFTLGSVFRSLHWSTRQTRGKFCFTNKLWRFGRIARVDIISETRRKCYIKILLKSWKTQKAHFRVRPTFVLIKSSFQLLKLFNQIIYRTGKLHGTNDHLLELHMLAMLMLHGNKF